jgi:hypothetical protein
MKYLLEFYEFEDISELKEIIRDILLSEIDESIEIKITEKIFLNTKLKTKIVRNTDFDFPCHLISLSENISEEQFKNISERLETILSIEFDNKFKCLESLVSSSIFYLIDEIDYFKIKSINEFEEGLEEAIWQIDNNEYSPVIDLTVDDLDDWENNEHKSIIIWIRLFNSKIGLSMSLIKRDIKNNIANYDILVEPVFNSNKNLIDRFVSKINMERIDPRIIEWIKNNIPIHYGRNGSGAINKIKEFEKSIENLNLSFNLDLNSDCESESDRLIEMIREKVFPIFSNDFTTNLSKLYQQFKKLEEYNIDTNWTNQGNYYFVFDINYKDKFHLLNVKFDTKTKNTVEIEFKDLNIKEVIPIEKFSETIFLYLEEN